MNEKKILIVDDEPDILSLLEEGFGSEGYEVFAAGSAEEALDILKQENFMVMFFDLKLPGMGGIELCKRIRKESQIPIIHAFTGYTNSFSLIECRAAGFDDFFTKPVALPILLKAVKDAFGKIERWNFSEHDLS